MTTSEISDKNVVMASFDDMPEEVRKAVIEPPRGGVRQPGSS
jgi:hypothetical protein